MIQSLAVIPPENHQVVIVRKNPLVLTMGSGSESAINSNFSMGSTYTTNQLTLSGAKTYKIFNKPVQFSIGPTYMATTTAYSAKSWGGYLAISFSIPEKFNYQIELSSLSGIINYRS